MEISHTFAYLHVGFPRPIVYSLMCSTQFFLDEHFVPKLFDFSIAQCIPEGETQIKDVYLRGFVGYTAPEHISMGVIDEKCDAFGFGSLLLVLLTGQRATDILNAEFTTYDCYCNLEKKINEDNWFIEAVDPIIVGDGLSRN
ncbi:hypothetical protein Ddye_028177 [Dipteronia dyeriana]|uniref:Protein kinase domain-containing protein n=1 Tax=Dipteronia dyeriana TaxID=168575 RepID=A0AAD9WS39_9ROSI|nr:hypothetical protein Ddye_028177 [Dipteronia dyeriana]